MNTKKAYVSPRVIRVNLEPTQAGLSHCSVGTTKIGDGGAFCNSSYHGGQKAWGDGDDHAGS